MFFEKHITKKMALIGLIFVFVTISIGLLYSTPQGYDPSIYDSFPPIFWILLIITEIIGLQILINEIIDYKKCNNQFKFHNIGILLITLVNFIILTVPLKYNFYGINDAVTHIGYVRDIFMNGIIGNSNFYPLSHIFAVFTSILANLDILKSIMIMTPLFYLIYTFGIFLLSRKITTDEIKRVFIIIFAIMTPVGIYGSEFAPIGIGIFCIPLLLYLLLNNDKIEYSILFTLACFFSVFIHPLISAYLILLLVTYYVANRIYGKMYKKESLNLNPLNSISLIFITLLTWIGSFWIFSDRILRLVSWFSGELTNSYLEKYQTSILKTGYGFFDTFQLLAKTYGPILIYITLFTIALIFIIKKIISKEDITKEQLFFGMISLIFGLISLSFFISGFNIAANPLRLVALALITCAIFCGVVFPDIIMYKGKNEIKKILFSSVVILLIISTCFGVYNIHQSPITKKTSMDMSNALYSGGAWLSTNTKTTNTIYITSYNVDRMRENILGYEASKPNSALKLQPHFGYENYTSVGYTLRRTGLIPLTIYDTYYYEKLWPTQGSFNSTDFEHLREDNSASLVYSNGEFDLFYAQKIVL